MNIDVYSDVVCPWCFVGKRRLAKALDATGLRGVARVRWRPFELNPGLPAGGVDRRAYMEAKFGGGHAEAEKRLETIGGFEGIPFRFDRIARVPNTFNAHRLVLWAEREGRQDAVAEALFRAYFAEGRDVGDPAVLAAAAAESGLSSEKAAAFLAGGEHASDVRAAEDAAGKAGIRFVPYFVIDGKFTIRGAEDAGVMAGVLREAAGPISTQNA